MALPTSDNTVNVTRLGSILSTLWGKIKTKFALKADLASPAFTGTPTAPTASAGTSSTQIATTAFVQDSHKVFVADYHVTLFSDIVTAITAGKAVVLRMGSNPLLILSTYTNTKITFAGIYDANDDDTSTDKYTGQTFVAYVTSEDEWGYCLNPTWYVPADDSIIIDRTTSTGVNYISANFEGRSTTLRTLCGHSERIYAKIAEMSLPIRTINYEFNVTLKADVTIYEDNKIGHQQIDLGITSSTTGNSVQHKSYVRCKLYDTNLAGISHKLAAVHVFWWHPSDTEHKYQLWAELNDNDVDSIVINPIANETYALYTATWGQGEYIREPWKFENLSDMTSVLSPTGWTSYNTKSTSNAEALPSGSIASGDTGYINGGTAYTALDNKVDKVSGKDLSTNDFTDTLKTKLDNIAANATKTESSSTNGAIKINGTDTTVYTHPTATAAAAAAVKVGNDSSGHVVLGSALTASDINLGNVANTNITVSAADGVKDNTNNVTYKYTHPTTTAASAAAVQVGKDSSGHVVLGNALTASDVGVTVTSTSVSDGTNTFNKYVHPTTAGNKHIPSGGSSGQLLGYSAAGTAQWVDNPNVVSFLYSTTDTTLWDKVNDAITAGKAPIIFNNQFKGVFVYTGGTVSSSDFRFVLCTHEDSMTVPYYIDRVYWFQVVKNTGCTTVSSNDLHQVIAKASTDSTAYKLLFSDSSSPTSGFPMKVRYDTGITVTPSTNVISGVGISTVSSKYNEADLETNTDYAINLNNSNIIGANSIYFNDVADGPSEAIEWKRSNSTSTEDHYDALYAKDSVLYFCTNRSHTTLPNGSGTWRISMSSTASVGSRFNPVYLYDDEIRETGQYIRSYTSSGNVNLTTWDNPPIGAVVFVTNTGSAAITITYAPNTTLNIAAGVMRTFVKTKSATSANVWAHDY